jgi:hypothetical protein
MTKEKAQYDLLLLETLLASGLNLEDLGMMEREQPVQFVTHHEHS